MTRGVDGQSLNTRGLFPAGEGAGYAGGILSAGVDGIKAAEAVAMADDCRGNGARGAALVPSLAKQGRAREGCSWRESVSDREVAA